MAAVPEFVIVGVAPTQNITGLFNAEKPWMYLWPPGLHTASALSASPAVT